MLLLCLFTLHGNNTLMIGTIYFIVKLFPEAHCTVNIILRSCSTLVSSELLATDISLTNKLLAVSIIFLSAKDRFLSDFKIKRSRNTLAISNTEPVLILSRYSLYRLFHVCLSMVTSLFRSISYTLGIS